jgi:hypothetical protein
VTGRCYARHRHQEFLTFLQLVAKRYPKIEIHMVLDNYRELPSGLVEIAADRPLSGKGTA